MALYPQQDVLRSANFESRLGKIYAIKLMTFGLIQGITNVKMGKYNQGFLPWDFNSTKETVDQAPIRSEERQRHQDGVGISYDP